MGWFRRRTGSAQPGSAQACRTPVRVRPERRKPVEVHLIGSNWIDILHARDVSTTGLGLYVAHRFDGCRIDSEVDLVITLPGVKSFGARGIVKHVTAEDGLPGHFGVEFTGLADRHRSLIAGYVEQRLDE